MLIHHSNDVMRLAVFLFVAALLLGVHAASPPLPCLSSAPSLNNVFSTDACTFVPAELSDFFYGDGAAIAAFLNRPGVHCKPSLIAKDIAIAYGAYAAIRYLESVRFPQPAPTGTAYSPAVCSAFEGPLVTSACGKTGKRDHYFPHRQTRGKPNKDTTQPPATQCNNPAIPQSCANFDQANPLQYNTTLWYEGNFDPSDPYAYSYGIRLPRWIDLFALDGQSTSRAPNFASSLHKKGTYCCRTQVQG